MSNSNFEKSKNNINIIESKENKEKNIKKLLKIFDKNIVYFVIICLGIFIFLYLQFWTLSYPNPNATFSLLLDVIGNLLPTALLFLVSYIFLREVNKIKDEENKNDLVYEISKDVQEGIDKRLFSMKEKVDIKNKITVLGHEMLSLGINGITPNWAEYAKFEGHIGLTLKEKLEHAIGPATWYIVTICPEYMLKWMEEFQVGVEQKNITLKWVYHSRKSLEDFAIDKQWEMLVNLPKWKDRSGNGGLAHHKLKVGNLHTAVVQSMNRIERFNKEQKKKCGSWHLYESSLPHSYMGFIAIPGRENCMVINAPLNSFGFIHFYPMFPDSYDERLAIYIESPGRVFDYYYRSTINLFNEGCRRKYVEEVEPSNYSTQN